MKGGKLHDDVSGKAFLRFSESYQTVSLRGVRPARRLLQDDPYSSVIVDSLSGAWVVRESSRWVSMVVGDGGSLDAGSTKLGQ